MRATSSTRLAPKITEDTSAGANEIVTRPSCPKRACDGEKDARPHSCILHVSSAGGHARVMVNGASTNVLVARCQTKSFRSSMSPPVRMLTTK